MLNPYECKKICPGTASDKIHDMGSNIVNDDYLTLAEYFHYCPVHLWIVNCEALLIVKTPLQLLQYNTQLIFWLLQ